MRLIRLQAHPGDPEVVLLHTPPDAAADMGRFEAARYDADRRAYALHRDTVPSLYRFARHIGAHVLDERTTPGERRLPHECAHCAQPGSVSNPPRFCPSCGEEWTPVVWRDTTPSTVHGECSRCGHRQPGAFPRCSRCGGEMAYPKPERRVELPRTRLPDPLPLAEVVAEVAQTWPVRPDAEEPT